MRDPINVFETLRDYYISYYETPYELRDPGLSAERRSLLLRPGEIAQEPLLEVAARYESSEKSIHEAASALGFHSDFADFTSLGLFPSQFKLYAHQYETLEATRRGRGFVITTGTGSGKTEAFLLPVVQSLLEESRTWSEPGSPPPPWWTGNGPWIPQRAHETRPAAIRCIIIYPMNALVEDQLRRLRLGLDSAAARSWLDHKRDGNRFYFGRYTGQTPVSGEATSAPQLTRLRTILRDLYATADRVRDDLDRRYFFPQLDGAEMRSRWDIVEFPPDILITNYSMLNVMLMRDREERMFDLTRQWLDADPSHVLTLVVDELHMYRGTAGTEVSLLLRSLRRRLGLGRRPKQLRIFAASASLSPDDQGLQYVRQFFGDPRFTTSDFYVGRLEPLPPAPPGGVAHLYIAFRAFDGAWQAASSDVERRGAADSLATALGQPIPDPALAPAQALGEIATAALLPTTLVSVYDADNRRPLLLNSLAARLFPATATGLSAEEQLAALRGLVRAVTAGAQPDGSPRLALRAHLFFRSVRGAWACSNPDCPAVPAGWQSGERRVGKLFLQPQLRCTHECGSRVLELLYCEICGEAFLGGYRKRSDNGLSAGLEYLLPDVPDLEQLPDLPAGGRTFDRYVVYWPSPASPADTAKSWTMGGVSFKFKQAVYEPRTGCLQRQGFGATGWSFEVGDPSLSAFPSRCPRCAEDRDLPAIAGGVADRLRSPVRTMGTGFEKISQVLADAQARLIRDGGAQPKLVVFSDSRQDAAKLSTGLEASHYQDLVRQLLSQLMERLGGDLRAFLDLVNGGSPSEAAERYKAANPHEAMALLLRKNGMASPDDAELARRVAASVNGPWPVSQLAAQAEQHLLALGVNPAGPDFSVQHYYVNQQPYPWTDLYDLDSWLPRARTNLGPEANTLLGKIQSKLRDQIRFTLFAGRGRDLESLGLGWSTFAVPAGTPDSLRQAADSAIRILGSRYRVIGSRDPTQSMPAYLRRYLDAVAPSRGQGPQTFRDDVERLLVNAGAMQPGYLVDVDRLFIAGAGPQVWQCRACLREHLHPSGGVCTSTLCLKPLARRAVVAPPDGVLGRDYFEVLARSAGDPFRLHCEELTGQTDLHDSLRRQRLFQGITVGGDRASIDEVDLLSVTTTMEAGVDIGGLQAVMMSNMPPRRFNYQQRVGRAGRRNDPLSVALTICRGRTHDDFYFNNSERITGDPPPQPYIDLSRPEIVRRVAAAECLRLAFQDLAQAAAAAGRKLDLGNNTHGQFGKVVDWSTHRPRIAAWLSTSRARVEDAVDGLLIPEVPSELLAQRSVLVRFLTGQLLAQIDDAISSAPPFQDDLAELLANRGLLPMFGFPTGSRVLYQRRPSARDWPPTKNVVDRDIDLAISQFAPGAQTVKDKAIYTAVGVVGYERRGPNIVPVPNPLDPTSSAGLCRTCQALTTQDSITSCPVCGEADPEQFRLHQIFEPPGFRTDYRAGKPYTGLFEWTPRASRARVSEGETVGPARAVPDLAVTVRSAQGTVYAINDNDGRDYDFVRDPSVDSFVVPSAFDYPRPDLDGLPTTLRALASLSVTDILLLGLDEASLPVGITLRPTSVIGRAAWYSFGFLLRRAASELLDVDVNELRVGVRVFREQGTPRAELFISDDLENGAGYATHLAEDHVLRQLFDRIGHESDPDSLAGKFATHKQAGKLCDSSCHDCLRDYSNMAFHGLLDWRLALDLTDLAVGRSLPEQRWLREAPAVRDQLCEGFGWNPLDLAGVPAVERPGEGVIQIFTHPLWTTDPKGFGLRLAMAYTEAKRRPGVRQVGFASIFDAVRRPGQLAWTI